MSDTGISNQSLGRNDYKVDRPIDPKFDESAGDRIQGVSDFVRTNEAIKALPRYLKHGTLPPDTPHPLGFE